MAPLEVLPKRAGLSCAAGRAGIEHWPSRVPGQPDQSSDRHAIARIERGCRTGIGGGYLPVGLRVIARGA